jgi:F0F1-type ATP synthase delta subunit
MNINVTTAVELSQTQKKKVINEVEKKYPQSNISFDVKSEVIGGVKDTVGSKQIDMTLQSQLSQLQKSLKEE